MFRFGPDVLRWQHCSTAREYFRYGLVQSTGFYIISACVLVLYSNLGKPSPVTLVSASVSFTVISSSHKPNASGVTCFSSVYLHTNLYSYSVLHLRYHPIPHSLHSFSPILCHHRMAAYLHGCGQIEWLTNIYVSCIRYSYYCLSPFLEWHLYYSLLHLIRSATQKLSLLNLIA